jgi:2-polyprenyl-6-methoxyphenol hydroxylase-like FAD-dependent oxidoreductase
MRVAILGAGPAGLYLSYRLKRRRPQIEVRVIEQNSADATFGFGVVFSDRALEFLCEDDPETYSAITPHLESWTDIAVSHRGEVIRMEGIGFSAISRLRLLQILQERARSVGINPVYRRAVASLDELGEPDLIVGADGANSLVRNTFAVEFGTTLSYLNNRFAWFGTTRRFETLTQTFRASPLGHFNAHHYRYSPGMSTFIVETDRATFDNVGFDRLGEKRSKAICEEVFAEELGGCALVTNRSTWRQFPNIWNARWWHRNCVLVGDALRAAHFSIGSGTRLAMEDVIALDRALHRHNDNVASALPAFEAARRPIVEKLVTAANASAEWYEHFVDHMRLAPIDFAMSYLTRSGRVSRERLRAISPRFLARYEAAQSATTAIAGMRA